ncbi:IclR family transcriptional regulator [Halapricum desulfuricans]|uniref:DNA-binding transcriptional regulator, IclR family n=1 Tax=Halapricum desulfuricans TaxID=2841257 RepID=A0A897P0B9_9EURY|nr:IclR family transcriptional regulator [Halapricum desulfuricans]QSG16279.1 DNA-binding transcriptional regulator, IclR family [Halapricum desulfuricans]
MDTPNIPEASTFDRQTAKTTVTTFRIVEALKRQPWTRVSDLADELDLAKGTVHKHLSTLQKVNYVVQEGEQYRLSLRFMGLGTTARSNLEIYQVAYRPVEKLAEATGEVASIMIAENGYGVYVLRVSAEGRPDIDIREGDSVPLTATAGGKAILANMSTEERDHIIDRNGLPELTENTITDTAELRDELRRVRNRRRAIDRGEYHPDQRCVAAPITNLEGNPLGAVIVSGPSDRMNEKVNTADFTSLVGSTADSIQSHLYH